MTPLSAMNANLSSNSMNIRNRFRSTATHYVVTNYPVEKEPTLFNQ